MRSRFAQAGYDLLSDDLIFDGLKNRNRISCHLDFVIRSRFAQTSFCLFVCLFCCFMSQVSSYGHWGRVSSPNHTFSWASLNKQLTSTSCTYFRL